MRVFWKKGLDGVGSLSAINPADSLGDGSNSPLVPDDDYAVVFHDGKVIFYRLRNIQGIRIGFSQVPPLTTPGTLTWQMVGYTGDRMQVPSASEFTYSGSAYPPDWASPIKRTFENYGPEFWLDTETHSPGNDFWWGAVAVYGGYLMFFNDNINELWRIRIADNNFEVLPWPIDGTTWFYECGGQDFTGGIPERFIFTLKVGDQVMRKFDLATLTYEPNPVVPASVRTLHAPSYTTGTYSSCFIYQGQMYIFGGRQNFVFLDLPACSKLNLTTMVHTQLADIPFACRYPSVSPDFSRGKVLVMGFNFGDPTYKAAIYDIALNSWQVIPDMPLVGLYGQTEVRGMYFPEQGVWMVPQGQNPDWYWRNVIYDEFTQRWIVFERTHYAKGSNTDWGADNYNYPHPNWGLIVQGVRNYYDFGRVPLEYPTVLQS